MPSQVIALGLPIIIFREAYCATIVSGDALVPAIVRDIRANADFEIVINPPHPSVKRPVQRARQRNRVLDAVRAFAMYGLNVGRLYFMCGAALGTASTTPRFETAHR